MKNMFKNKSNFSNKIIFFIFCSKANMIIHMHMWCIICINIILTLLQMNVPNNRQVHKKKCAVNFLLIRYTHVACVLLETERGQDNFSDVIITSTTASLSIQSFSSPLIKTLFTSIAGRLSASIRNKIMYYNKIAMVKKK